MADKLTTQEENGEKVFTVELAPGSEVTMQTADTYVDKNIKVNAKAYTGGTGITVDNNAHTISVDNTVVTASKLPSRELQAIDLDPKSSHVTSQIFTAVDGFIGPAYNLYTYSADGTLNQNSYGGLYVEAASTGSPVVGVMAQNENALVALASSQARPYYYNTADSSLKEIALKDDATSVVANPAGTASSTLTKIKINDVSYNLGEVTKAKIISALGYTPYDDSNPRNFLSSLTYSDITTALGFVPYNSTNPNNYISEITGDDVRGALGYTPYDSANPNGYITGISKNDVTAALGFTPYSSANPNNYITKSVSDLVNYYSKTTIDGMIGQGLQTKIVQTLPTTGIKTNIIYLVPLSGSQDGYTQWMHIENSWEKLGTTNINLSEYAKSADLSDVAKSGSYTSLLDKPEIPTDLGDLSNSAGYVKTDTVALVNYTKTSDLATVAITGSYNDLANKPAIPTTLGALENDVNYVTSNDLAHVNISTFVNDVNYAKISDIQALQELDVDAIKEAIAITANVGTIKGVLPGSGLTGGGETGKVTLSHSNNVTAKTAYSSNATSVASGGTFTVTDVKYDENGHITASRDREISIPEIPNVSGMLTTSNYSDTLDAAYQAKGNYQAAGDYLGPTNAVNDNTGNYVVNVTQDTRGQIKVTKGTLPSITVIEGSTTTPSTDTVDVLSEITSNGHAVTKQKTTVASKKYIDDLVGDINAILDTINGEAI